MFLITLAVWMLISCNIYSSPSCLWCCSLRARYICIVAVQHCPSGKIDLLILSKLVAVEKSVFTSSHVLLQYSSSIFWGAMKRYLREPPEKHSKSECHGFCWCAFQLEIGASDDTMDGCWWEGYNTGKEVWQLQTVLLPLSLWHSGLGNI